MLVRGESVRAVRPYAVLVTSQMRMLLPTKTHGNPPRRGLGPRAGKGSAGRFIQDGRRSGPSRALHVRAKSSVSNRSHAGGLRSRLRIAMVRVQSGVTMPVRM